MATYQPYNEYSSVTGGGFENPSDSRPNTMDSGAGGSNTNTLTPVTIKQILDSQQAIQDGPFVTHNQELHHVCFVGVVRNITDHTSNIFLTLEDGTGQIEVRKWSDDTSDVAQGNDGDDGFGDSKSGASQIAQQYQIGTYVKVFGALKEFGGKKNIQYAVIKNVESFNDVIAHHLEAIKCHAIANGKMQGTSTSTSSAAEGQSLFVSEDDGNNKNPLQRILEFCKQQCIGKDANTFAVPIPLISQSLDIDETTVRNCCTTLTEQGFIYPTLDDNHFFAVD
ncbi:Ribosome-associated molecular chaperone SSB2 [Nakaseomyces bracarensis]|uniref:Ribosome-associated molecular chaperone SSB2 n=1 Tax=Nakaseomyces bracarensis TaxID=273131 RepID=A0ABR4NWM9_9SACH